MKAPILILGVALTVACNRAPAGSPQDSAAPQLSQVPAADPAAFQKIDVRAWKNPYLIINADNIGLLDVANHEEKLMKADELPAALSHLPQSAWPYGRVVAVTVHDSATTEDERVSLRKNRALVAGTLKDLQIYVNWVPSS